MVSVIISDFYVAGVWAVPAEAHPILVVYADTVLAGTFAFEGFEVVARREA